MAPNIKGMNAQARKAFELANADYYNQYGEPIIVNSGFRSFADQQRLYNNRANNPYPVAKPGTSAHETGLALDIQNYEKARPFLEKHGFSWYGVKDPVHFTFNSGQKVSPLVQAAAIWGDKQKQANMAAIRLQQQQQEQARQSAENEALLKAVGEATKLQIQADKNDIQAGFQTQTSQDLQMIKDALFNNNQSNNENNMVDASYKVGNENVDNLTGTAVQEMPMLQSFMDVDDSYNAALNGLVDKQNGSGLSENEARALLNGQVSTVDTRDMPVTEISNVVGDTASSILDRINSGSLRNALASKIPAFSAKLNPINTPQYQPYQSAFATMPLKQNNSTLYQNFMKGTGNGQ